jgi:Flp pilus assembly protein TadG
MKDYAEFDQMKRKAQPGQALLETAIILPILLLLILGAMDFGRMFITKIVLTNAARAGADYLTENPNDKDNNYAATYAIIREEISNSRAVKASLVTVDPPANCCTSGSHVGITVKATDIPLIFGGFYKQFFKMADSLVLSSTVKMVVQ